MAAQKKRRTRGTGSLFYSPSLDRWVARKRLPGTSRFATRVGMTQRDAIQNLDRALKEHAAKNPPLDPPTPPVGCEHCSKTSTSMQMGEYLDYWCGEIAKPRVELATWEAYERVIRVHLKPRIGKVRLEDFRPLKKQEFFNQLKKEGLSEGNIKKLAEVLSSALSDAVRLELASAPVAKGFPKLKVTRPKILPFAPSEIDRILEAARSIRLYALVVLGAMTGARQGELLGLHWETVYLDQAIPQIRICQSLCRATNVFKVKNPKSDHGDRIVSLPTVAAEVLREHRARMEAEGHLNENTPVFCTTRGHYCSSTNFVKRDWRPTLERAGVRYRKFHTLRHTHASILLSRGFSPVEVAQRLGDKVDTVMRIYSHYMRLNDEKIVQALNELHPSHDIIPGSPQTLT